MGLLRQSHAILILPGHTAANNAAPATPTAGRASGRANVDSRAADIANSATPEPYVHARCEPGRSGGTSASKIAGRTKCSTPAAPNTPAHAPARIRCARSEEVCEEDIAPTLRPAAPTAPYGQRKRATGSARPRIPNRRPSECRKPDGSPSTQGNPATNGLGKQQSLHPPCSGPWQ